MKKPPQNALRHLTPEVLQEYWTSGELKKVLERAQEKYSTWDVFRHLPFPKGISPEQAWAVLKIMYRQGQEVTPVKDKSGAPFSFNLTKGLNKRLRHIDTHTSGFVQTLSAKTTSAQRDQLIMSGLTEEAIASSQIEGANTSRKVAKEMLYSGRKPRTMSEQMIINNYQVMQLVEELKDLNLSEEMLLDVQKRITNKTMDDPTDGGRFRVDSDNIAVVDHATGEITFEPPKEADMRSELKRLIEFANEDDESDSSYLHPFIKATILHFWIAYLHPFVDGNGRTARAIFYWYLLKKKYWLFEYLSISRIIKKAKTRYDKAFLDTETDDNDLTYFVLYMSHVTCQAIDELKKYYDKKLKEADEIKSAAKKIAELNERQVALLSYFKTNKDKVTTIKRHQTVHGIVYETARQDLLSLQDKGLIVDMMKGKTKIYLPNREAIKKFLK